MARCEKAIPSDARLRRPATRREKAVKAAKAGGRGRSHRLYRLSPAAGHVSRSLLENRRGADRPAANAPSSMKLKSVSHGDCRESIGTEGHRGSDAPDGPSV